MTSALSGRSPTRRSVSAIAGQGAWLFTGFGAAQGLAFARNALLGHALSKGDFGVAATLTLSLQIVETLSDLGSDRLIVQARDGGCRRFVSTAHLVLILRGVLLAALLFAIGPFVAEFFGASHAVLSFKIIALSPLIKGFIHLDFRRAQRRFDNGPFLALEVGPQFMALAITLPVLAAAPSDAVVAWLCVVQAIASVALSHAVARRPYQLSCDATFLKRQIAFGWPILASAMPLVAVYHGDRMIIGRLQGLEQLAAYAAAFMITMAPGVIASKVAHAAMLPLFSSARRNARALAAPFTEMAEVTVVVAALYLSVFVIAGEWLLPLAFGANYLGFGNLTAWLAAMWAVRMLQAVPGMALMAGGETKPLLTAGFIRALALPCVLWAATQGADLATLAAIGAAFELASLAYVALRIDRLERGLGAIVMTRAAFLAPVAFGALLLRDASDASATAAVFSVVGALTMTVMLAVGLLPSFGQHVWSAARQRHRSRAGAIPTSPTPSSRAS